MNRIIALSLAITAGTAMAYASDSDTHTALDDATTQQITQILGDQGYEVTEIETEDDGYEVYALKDGTSWEIELGADLSITETEAEDEDDDDADDD